MVVGSCLNILCNLFGFSGVALLLCQSEPVLNDGKGGDDDSSREAVMAGVRRQFIERVVKDHEDKDNDDGGYSSD